MVISKVENRVLARPAGSQWVGGRDGKEREEEGGGEAGLTSEIVVRVVVGAEDGQGGGRLGWWLRIGRGCVGHCG